MLCMDKSCEKRPNLPEPVIVVLNGFGHGSEPDRGSTNIITDIDDWRIDSCYSSYRSK